MKAKLILRRTGHFLLTTIVLMLLSPKWVFPAAAWFAPFLIIWLIAPLKPWKAYVVAVLTLFGSSLISLYNVMPFPGIFFPLMTLVISLQAAVPYIVNRVLYPLIQHWTKTLVFPFALVIGEYVTSFGGGGSWSSISYTQVPNSFLIQAVSLGGIWIIAFVIGWFASLIFCIMEQRGNWQAVRTPVIGFLVLVLALTLFGFAKTNSFF